MEKEQLRRQNRVVVILVVILVCVGLGIHQFFNYSLKPVSHGNNEIVTVTIPKGATDHQVARILKQHRLVRSQYVFSYYLQTHKTGGVKAGKFRLKRSASVPEIATKLQQNKSAKKH